MTEGAKDAVTEEMEIATKRPWEWANFTNHDGSPIKSKEEIIALISESVMKGDGLYLYGVSVPGNNVVVCYTGNGPKAKENAYLIMTAVNSYESFAQALAQERRRAVRDTLESEAVKGLERTMREISFGCKGSKPNGERSDGPLIPILMTIKDARRLAIKALSAFKKFQEENR